MPNLDKDDVLTACAGRFASFYGQYTPLTKQGNEFRGPCPLHHGANPNFAVTEDGAWFCHSQCGEGGDVFSFLKKKDGLKFGDALLQLADFANLPVLLPGSVKDQKQASQRLVATYPYTDADGGLLFQAVRWEPKQFSQRQPDGKGGWIWNLDGVRRVLYHLPEVVAANAAGKPIYVTEGERDADGLRSLGLCATCNPMGAGKWEDAYTETLTGAGVVILPDNDDAGREHAQKVAAALHGKAKRLKVLQLPSLPDRGDVSDWIAAGGTKAELLELAKAASDWTPARVCETISPSAAEDTYGPSWPMLAPEVLHGLAGDLIGAIGPHSEADPAALLVQVLLFFGSVIGRTAFCLADGARHYGNEYAVIVGASMTGKKGTSTAQVRSVYKAVSPEWEMHQVKSGLSSGEGLIHHVRDPREGQVKDKNTGQMQTVTIDEGVEDKRLLVIETEFASVLRRAKQETNTLSTVIRTAWDTDTLRTMTKTSPAQATGAHVSIVGHITPDELRSDLTPTEALNGFGNRFLWVCSRRSKPLPDGGDTTALNAALAPLLPRLQDAIDHAQTQGELRRDDTARAAWHNVYLDLTTDRPGLSGAMMSRAAPHVLRLALLYAMLDGATVIRIDHLTAGLALWEYCEASARYIFGEALGDRVADNILRALRGAPGGMSRTAISSLFQNNQSAGRIGQALGLLAEHGLAREEQQIAEGKGRPVETWKATN